MNRTLTGIIVASVVLAAGCTQGTRSRTTIGQHQTLPALTGSPVGLTPATTPSVTGLDRSHWDMQPIVVAPDGSRAWFWRTYTDNRNAGAHPTAVSALYSAQSFGIRQVIGIPLRDAIGDGLLFPPRAVHTLLCDDPREQASAYERSKTGTWREPHGSAP